MDPVLRIRDVYPRSRIRLFSILVPGSRMHIKEFKYFNSKISFLSSRKYAPGCSSRIRILIFTHPGSRLGIRNTVWIRMILSLPVFLWISVKRFSVNLPFFLFKQKANFRFAEKFLFLRTDPYFNWASYVFFISEIFRIYWFTCHLPSSTAGQLQGFAVERRGEGRSYSHPYRKYCTVATSFRNMSGELKKMGGWIGEMGS